MKTIKPINIISMSTLLAVCGVGLWLPSSLRADVIVMRDGNVVTGKILQKDGDGVLIHTPSGSFRYPQSWIRDVRNEPDVFLNIRQPPKSTPFPAHRLP